MSEVGRSPGSPFAGVHVLADDDPRWPHDVLAQARAACAGGAQVVQLRIKHATDTRALVLAREIRQVTRDAGIRFVVNDRFDLALRSEADAVHLGQDDLPPARMPDDARARLAVGRSTHDAGQLVRATHEGVDYVAFGPLFGTASKDSAYAARGLPALAAAVRAVAPLPLIAIGGIDAARISEVIRAGAAGAAVISAVAAARNPVEATRTLVRAFAETTHA